MAQKIEPSPSEAPENPFLSVKATAKYLSLSPWTVYTLFDEGSIKSVYQKRRRYTRIEWIEDYVASLSSTSASA